ncbi:xylitol dehydrogenase [Dichomitus squalens LYAD-421 SS1]|uniref:Xylitol dehydrogenase n=1 Tax=Dichomitus squalens (strain LYAD-421) TaxID=732165 RepID=R7SZ43_DICSQ|nr:xylitol dehydrogenase [Dichomitus squalens LYAD-421 SS1]EJF61183.1 xylitol dehydrogenase [Dichomitus squalens LYAD-421 SS1]
MSNNPSFVLKKVEEVVYEERPIPDIKDDEVLVAVKKTGICGSDVHYLVHGRIGDFIVENPMVLGHESAGVVHKVGSKVTDLKPGDRVAMEPGATCRKCDACKRGRYELCPDIIFAATPPYDGTLARYYPIPADLCYKLPDNLTLEDGAMMEPLSVAIHSVANVAGLKPAETVVVFGAGPVGLLCMAVARALGAARVIAVDIVPSRLEFAKSYAATDTYLPPQFQEGESRIEYSRRNAKQMQTQLGLEERGLKAVDLIVDASGAEVSIQTGIYIAKHGGRYVQVGMGAPEIVIPITTLLVKEIDFKGSFRYGPGDYQLAIALVSQGRIDLKPLVTHRYSFDQAVEAFQATRAGKSPDGKPVIKAVISGPDVSPADLL